MKGQQIVIGIIAFLLIFLAITWFWLRDLVVKLVALI